MLFERYPPSPANQARAAHSGPYLVLVRDEDGAETIINSSAAAFVGRRRRRSEHEADPREGWATYALKTTGRGVDPVFIAGVAALRPTPASVSRQLGHHRGTSIGSTIAADVGALNS